MERSADKLGYFPFEGEFLSPKRIQSEEIPTGKLKTQTKRSRAKVDVHIMCSDTEREQLRILAQKCRLSMSDYCRKAIFGKKIVERLGEGQLEAYRMLLSYQGHFARMGEGFSRGDPQLAEEARQLAREIRNHLLKFGT